MTTTQPGTQPPNAQPVQQPDQATQDGGRREPIHPDDIEAGSGYLGDDLPPGGTKPAEPRKDN